MKSAERGQATVVLLFALAAVLLGAVALGGVARGLGARAGSQRAADLGALAGARSMRDDYDRLFEPVLLGSAPNPRHLAKGAYLARARAAALSAAAANGARSVAAGFPDAGEMAPVRVRVVVSDPVRVDLGGARRSAGVRAPAEARLDPPAWTSLGEGAGPGDYRGPLAVRQGKPMRPDVATAFDRMAAAAARAGIGLIVVSAFRSTAEQAVLFARHPDPKWVAPPGRSLHRLGTELDLGPDGAYGWLAANAGRFGFVKRYSWEPWHFGYVRNAGSASVGFARADGRGSLPAFVPARYAPLIARAAQRWNVGAALLAAQLYAESGFNPYAVSPAGARGIAQFMPGTGAAYGLRDPFDAGASIDAQARMMRDLLRRFGSVPLALAAYNAGPGAVARCGCIPPYPETRGYVARILGLLRGAGEPAGAGGLTIRLVR
ncbi:MAG: transglycosylase SLT domain-containing protein [Solirubrobacteraceae bacterium]